MPICDLLSMFSAYEGSRLCSGSRGVDDVKIEESNITSNIETAAAGVGAVGSLVVSVAVGIGYDAIPAIKVESAELNIHYV